MILIEVILFLSIALLGGVLGRLARIPIGSVIGAMLLVGIIQVSEIFSFTNMGWLTFVVQVLIGIMLGVSFLSVNKSVIKRISVGLIISLIGIILMIILIGSIISVSSSLDFKLAILSSAPGAVVEMATIATALDLDSPTVVLIHLFRVVIIMAIFPILIKSLNRVISEGARNKK
ncbi:AbrB family transcriptional regulator [Alkalicoccus saliphilus]|uniref:AbrB family transcriptional regulator n=1 Tax=Alkalicoccus saliphilus TaxID=200989 RepID=A0A2T4U3X2_9BACI|nr:AbrB family transcriptional regulator [Alkalicoccus saliphilus]PTL38100.1 hypothetical protein C6Y45_12960 [Alkalicoccus saliphilus]